MKKTNLFQILISKDSEAILPPSLSTISSELAAAFPSCEYSLWTDAKISKFLLNEYEEEVYRAYKMLAPFAYKSDLARYCLLYHFGGWYFDLGIQLALGKKVVAPLSKEVSMLFFWDVGDLLSPARSFYDCMNGIIYSKPSNPVLRIAIDLVLQNCQKKFYGTDSMSPTGPGVLGRAIAIHGKDESHYDGQFIQFTPQHEQKNRAYVLRDGTIFAWHRSRFKQGSDILSSFGLSGGNDYRKLWRDKMIYND